MNFTTQLNIKSNFVNYTINEQIMQEIKGEKRRKTRRTKSKIKKKKPLEFSRNERQFFLVALLN